LVPLDANSLILILLAIMAKVTGPFMSLDASGTLADTLTASKWKGRNYMRQRIIPANPRTTAQLDVRSILGTLAKAAHSVLTSFADTMGVGSPFFTAARDGAPSGQSWISWLQKVMYSLFGARVTAYAALSGTIKGYYVSAADAIGLGSYVDPAGDTHTSGEQLYQLAYFAVNYLGYTGFASGIDNATSMQASDFADWVHETTP
jgi:hypothetical protein